jgi:hypothetical protein
MRVHAIVEDIETARRAIVTGATVVQLRVKGPTEEVVVRGQGFRALGTTFIVNDDVDAALELGADGVHLGQSDSGAERARRAGSAHVRRLHLTRLSQRTPTTGWNRLGELSGRTPIHRSARRAGTVCRESQSQWLRSVARPSNAVPASVQEPPALL